MKQSSFQLALAIAAITAAPTAKAFTPSSTVRTPTTQSVNANKIQNIVSPLFAEDESKSSAASGVVKALDAGSHEELMYCLGVNLARQLGDVRPLVENGEELAQVARGLLDTVVGKLDDEDQRELLGRRGKELNEIIVARAKAIRDKLVSAGEAMLKEMSENPETATLESGVVIHPLEPGPDGFGKGMKPTASSTVKVHYHGTLPDGTVFDSSLGGDPITFPLGGVIKGWKEGLQHMCEGETAMLGIPPEMGYGEAGTPDGTIPGGASLFFKIQLLEVLSAGIGGGPKLVGADGNALKKDGGSVLLGADGKPMF